ncbi:MAG: LuxR C-terminal-related transcriptional regulator [Chloroflexota bacterium]
MASSVIHVEPVLLLRTKLYRPQADPHLLQRPHLIEFLNQSINRKLTLVTAPAGYGKSSLVAQWLGAVQDKQIAWLSLDESDNDLILFVHYLIAAIQQCQPNSCLRTLAALHNPQTPPWSQLVIMLVNDLVNLSHPLTLVIDDYHFVVQEEIHKFLDRLLDHLPPSFHLVLISRTEPPLSLPRLRVRQQMNELRTADLSFSHAETENYFARDMPTTLAPETIAALQDKSEGWIAGLYLARLSLGRSINEQTLLKQLQNNNTHIMDYLISEVLAQQPKAVQTFLLRTAILRRFCRPLCEALLEKSWLEIIDVGQQLSSDSQAPIQSIIDWLARQHLFTIPLDDNRDWYRYHHLFQLMLTRRLQKQMNATEVNELHQKASRWFAQEGLIDEALHHALAAANTPFAVQLVEQHRVTLLNQFEFHTLERWIARLPETIIKQRPHLLLLLFWLTQRKMRGAASVLPYMQQAEAFLTNNSATLDKADLALLQAELAAVRCGYHFWRNELQHVLDYYQQAMTGLPPSYLRIRVQLTLYAVFTLQDQGDPLKSIHLMQQELQHEATRKTLPKIWLRSYLSLIYYRASQLQQAVQAAHETIKLLENHTNHKAYTASVPHRWLGTIHYEWNDITATQQYSQKVDPTNISPYYNSQLLLAWSYDVMGQTRKADDIIEKLHHWALSLQSSSILNEIASFRAHRLYQHGDSESALGILRDVNVEVGKLTIMIEVPAFTLSKVLISLDQKSGWQEAKDLLEELLALSQKAQSIPSQVKILALQALLYRRQGEPDVALTTLERAITQAKPSGFIRTFVDLGLTMATLLYQLLERGFEPVYLGQILAAFPKTQQAAPPAPRTAQATEAQLIEPLTKRELDVLLLLAKELSNKKIAQQLSISPLTVKRHTINIYQKLSVSSRHDAVHTARALGIVPP